ncbi:MAG: hypothetical protein EA339_00625 [Rhodobacteraceae bacterium]|nr:MAG: hypothetical protein EA339_00625 [Paracoccaceae bacterium]
MPDGPSDAVTLRATFLRYLALGGCDACQLPETGLLVWGAHIFGDEKHSEDTKGLDFEGATLPHDLGLVFCHIPDPIILRSAKVKNLFLHGSVVKAAIKADRLQAEGGVFLREAKLAGKVQLLGARLGSNLDCDGAALQAKGEALICDRMQVEGSVFLRGAKITGEVRLLGARLGGDLDCDGAELQAKGTALICDGAKIAGAFFLRGGATVSGCIDLTDATFGSICDDPACWPPELILNRCRYGAFQGNDAPMDSDMRLKWLALQKPKKYGQDFWPDPYEHCAKVLREMGHGAEATKILIEKERLQRKARQERLYRDLEQAREEWTNSPEENSTNISAESDTGKLLRLRLHLTLIAIWDGITGFFVGYGRKPFDAVWRGLIPLWIVGTFVFANAERHGAIKPNLPQIQLNPAWVSCAADQRGQLDCFLNHPDAASYPRFNAFIYSADTLIPVVSLEMQSYWIPDDRSDRGMLARGYLWFHIAMGWALTLLTVAGFSGLIKTDNTK